MASNTACFHGDLIPEDEPLMLSHLQTDQQIIVKRSFYMAGLRGRYRNWRLAGTGNFVRPPILLSAFLFQQSNHNTPKGRSDCDTE